MRTAFVLSAALLAACSSTPGPAARDGGADGALGLAAPVAAIAGGLAMLGDLDLLDPEYIAGMLVAFAIYDPLAPTWRVDVREAGGERVRMALKMKSLVIGGDGEARQVFLRSARQLVEAGGFAGYEVVHYEEGVESTRPFARRYANAEIRLIRSHTFPSL